MLSYAQNAEDVVLARAFGAQPSGFYVDVGANHPELGSVTKHFYDRGWSGINIEPGPADYALLCEARPRDVNLRLALSDRSGQARLYQTGEENGGGSTLRADLARRLRQGGAELVEVEVELATLADVCARHAARPIDFLKIDVEGSEEQVIRGGDWARYRPSVVLVEATEPGSTVPSHAAWEPLILAAGYDLALFDGLNRFYVRAEDAALLPRLAAPANAHDGWEPHRYVGKIVELERYAASLRQHVSELESQSAERERYVTDVRQHLERCQAWAKVLEGKVRRFEEHLGLLPDTLPPPLARYTGEDFVRFLYAALMNRSDAPGTHVDRWADRLRAGATMLELFDAFLATPEGHHAFWTNPFFQRYLRPEPPALAFIDVPELAAHLGVVKVLDVGAMPLANQDDVYRPLVRSGRCAVVGFEPLVEARRVRQLQDREFVVHRHVVGDGSVGVFHHAAVGATSSLYRPDLGRMADFAGLAETCRVVGEDPVPTVRLDDVDDCRGAAFCKLDVQGAELDVLRGAPTLLRELLVLHVETEFVPIYERQPLFAEVDAHLRAAGFELYAFPHLEHYRYGGAEPVNGCQPSRLLWGDAVFVPTRERILALPVGRAMQLCWIMHELYRTYDFCRWLLARLNERVRTPSFVGAYDRILASIPR